MPTLEGLEEAGLEKIPDLGIARMRFQLNMSTETAKQLNIDQAQVGLISGTLWWYYVLHYYINIIYY